MKNWKLKCAWSAAAAIFAVYLLIHGLKSREPAYLESPNRIVMSTIAKVSAVAPHERTARLSIDAAFEKIFEVERLMNRYDPNSQLSRVNLLAAKGPVRVDEELFDVLGRAVRYSRLSGGAFDITVGPLIDLWKKCAEANAVPTDEQLAAVKKIIGCEKLLLDSNDFSVRFAADGMKLDLGGIAKGFAVDLAVEEMKKSGATGGLVAVGGEIGCFGTAAKKDKWIVGIQDPAKLEENQTIAKLALSDMFVSTSGGYRRFYTIGGRQFSHIFNPATEKSAGELSSVTVIAAGGVQADAFATAVSVLGAEKGLELVEKTENTEAILIKTGSQELIKSGGAERYLAK